VVVVATAFQEMEHEHVAKASKFGMAGRVMCMFGAEGNWWQLATIDIRISSL